MRIAARTTVLSRNRVSLTSDDEYYGHEVSLQEGDDKDDISGVPQLWRNVNRMKNELKFTLSDPLKRHAAGSIKRARDCAAALPGASSVKKKVTELSNRLTMPKFFQEHSRPTPTIPSSNINARIDDEASSSDDSKDPEFQELQERSCIVEKYEKGPEQEVEEWENPDNTIFKVTDRYGFVHKDEDAALASVLAEKKRIAKELSREQKWLGMIARWKEGKPVEKLRSRVWKGIPEKLRSVVWTYLLEVSKHKRESQHNLYRELLMRARLISNDIKQIDLDINRTYRDHLNFRQRYSVKQRSLFNVLAAYAMYNTEVGYCQGMSQIAALFLMYMDEEDAFWCLHALLVNKRHSMHGFFVPGFPKLVRFQAHYEMILQKFLPRVKKHLDKAGIPPIYLTKWWFGCFLDRVPFSLALRLWDVFLLEGDVILLAMSYNIMKMHQKSIRKLQIENFMNYVQTTIATDFGYSDEQVMESLEECLRRLRSERMVLQLRPGPNDPPELPTKPLGPVLTRSMIDIRLDIAEIQSRHSRANSVAGRSPGIAYRGRTPPSPTPLRTKLKFALEAQKEEPEVPSSSSASTIKSNGSQKDARSGAQTPIQQQQQLSNGRLSPVSPVQSSGSTSKDKAPQIIPVSPPSSAFNVTNTSLSIQKRLDADKSVSPRNEKRHTATSVTNSRNTHDEKNHFESSGAKPRETSYQVSTEQSSVVTGVTNVPITRQHNTDTRERIAPHIATSLSPSHNDAPLTVSTETSLPYNKVRYKESPMISSRYVSPHVTHQSKNRSYFHEAPKSTLSFPTNDLLELDSTDAVEMSRGVHPRRVVSPPEPPIDYDLPSSPRKLSTSFNSSMHSVSSNSTHSPRIIDPHRVDDGHWSYGFAKQKGSPPHQSNWIKTEQKLRDATTPRGFVRKDTGNFSGNQEHRKSFYDNLDDVATTLSVLPKPVEEIHGKKSDPYNGGSASKFVTKTLYSGAPNHNLFVGKNNSVYSGSQFSSGNFNPQFRNDPPRYQNSQQKVTVKSYVRQTPDNVTYVSVGEEKEDEKKFLESGQPSKFPVQNELCSRWNYVGPNYYQNEQQYLSNREKLPRTNLSKQITAYPSVIRGDAYNARSKYSDSKRRYLPDPRGQLSSYPSSVAPPQAYVSNRYGNHTLL